MSITILSLNLWIPHNKNIFRLMLITLRISYILTKKKKDTISYIFYTQKEIDTLYFIYLQDSFKTHPITCYINQLYCYPSTNFLILIILIFSCCFPRYKSLELFFSSILYLVHGKERNRILLESCGTDRRTAKHKIHDRDNVYFGRTLMN